MTTHAPPAEPSDLDEAQARAIVARAIERYIAARRRRVRPFVDRNFSPRGALRLHARALGLDLLRAPVNVTLVLPFLLLQLTGAGLMRVGAQRTGRWLRERRPFLETDVARELAWRLHVDLLELPFDNGRRRSDHDALRAAVLADPDLQAALEPLRDDLAGRHADPSRRRRLDGHLGTYTGARNAAADLFNNALLAGAGLALFQKITPGTLTLGPVVASALAHQAAVSAFPFGATIGGLWYGAFPPQPSAMLVVGATVGLMLATAITAAFAGVVSDPLQRALGLHERRLHRLVDALARELEGDSEAAFAVRDHYVARIFDLIDLSRASWRSLSA